MIQLTPQMRILAATEPADFRCGIDGLARLCRARLREDPFSGTVFAFINRSATAVKILCYDSQGFWICHKRLSKGKFSWWPRDADATSLALASYELHLLLWNGDPSIAKIAPPWRPLKNA